MNEEQSSSNHNTYFQQSWIVREYILLLYNDLFERDWEHYQSLIDLLLQEINNSQTMIINVHNACMKLVMIENVYGKFHKIYDLKEHMKVCKNMTIWNDENC